MDPFEQLLTQPSGSNVAPETLEMLGRQASQLFRSQGLPLNQAVSKVLADHPELGNEHIRRIIEFANTVTFQEMFQSSDDKNVHFDVADPGVVIRDLRDGGSSAHSGQTLHGDYQRSPEANQNPDLDAALAQQFTGTSPSPSETMKVAGVKKDLKTMGLLSGASAIAGASGYTGARAAKKVLGNEKTAAVLQEVFDQEKHANPIDDLYDAKIRLEATREHLTASYEQMDLLTKQAEEDFYRQVKQQVADPDGSGLGGVLGALEKVAAPDLLELIMLPVVERLVKEGYDQNHLSTSLRKMAGAVPNLEHPLFASFDAIIKLAEERVTCDRAISDVDKMIADINIPFKKLAGALTTGVKKVMDPRGLVPAGIRQRFPRE